MARHKVPHLHKINAACPCIY